MITRDVSCMPTFACTHCLTHRPYSFTHDEDLVLINCEKCQKPTRHQYLENNEYEAIADMRPDKIVSITFTRATRG